MLKNKLVILIVCLASQISYGCVVFNDGTEHETILSVIHVSSIEDLIMEIGKLKPDAVEVDMGLYDRIGGIDTVQMIKDRLNVNAWFK